MGNASSAEFGAAAATLVGGRLEEDEESLQLFLNKLLPETALTPQEVFASIQPQDVRVMRQRYPRNLALMLYECVGVMTDAVQEPDGSNTIRAMNAVRLLTRVMPILLEDPAAEDRFVERFFWQNQFPVLAAAVGAKPAAAAVEPAAAGAASSAAAPAAAGAASAGAAAGADAAPAATAADDAAAADGGDDEEQVEEEREHHDDDDEHHDHDDDGEGEGEGEHDGDDVEEEQHDGEEEGADDADHHEEGAAEEDDHHEDHHEEGDEEEEEEEADEEEQHVDGASEAADDHGDHADHDDAAAADGHHDDHHADAAEEHGDEEEAAADGADATGEEEAEEQHDTAATAAAPAAAGAAAASPPRSRPAAPAVEVVVGAAAAAGHIKARKAAEKAAAKRAAAEQKAAKRKAAAAAKQRGGAGAAAAAEQEEVEAPVSWAWIDRPDAMPAFPLGAQLVHALASLLFSPAITVEAGAYEKFAEQLLEAQEKQRKRDQRALAAEAARQPRATGDADAAALPAGAAAGMGVDVDSDADSVAAAPKPARGAGAAGAAKAAASDDDHDADDADHGDHHDADAGSEHGEGHEEGEEEEEHHDDDGSNDPIPTEANAVWPMLLWAPGSAFLDVSVGRPTSNMVVVRTELLRLVIALCSGPVYEPPAPLNPVRSAFLDELTGGECPFAPTLFYSLLHTVLSHDPVGWGVPYASTLFTDGGEEELVQACLHALLVLLDYGPLATTAHHHHAPPSPAAAPLAAADAGGGDGAAEGAPAAPPASTAAAQYNVARSLLGGLQGVQAFNWVSDNIARLLNTIPTADGSLLPQSKGSVSYAPDLLVLLWKVLDENAAFLSHCVTHTDTARIMMPALYLMWTGRHDVAKDGLIHLCTFLLLLLSGERSFSVGLNRPLPGKLPAADMPLIEGGGSHMDLLILVLHKIVVDGSPRLSALYSCFLTIIANVSPYAKGLSLAASTKLLNLMELFASPRFLLARPGNYMFVLQLAEAFNNLVQYQYESNGMLVYTLLRRRQVFDGLAALSVSGWLEAQAARRLKRLAAAAGGQPPAAAVAAAVPAAAAPAAAAGAAADGASAAAAPGGEAAPGDGTASHTAAWIDQQAAQPAVAGVSAADAATGPHAAATGGVAAVDPLAAWAPTDAWWEAVKRQIPLGTVIRMVNYLQPIVEAHAAAVGGALDDESVIEFIRSTTVVGILPVPHRILVRRYTPNAFTSAWFTTFIWSSVYLHLAGHLPLFDATAIRMFTITVE